MRKEEEAVPRCLTNTKIPFSSGAASAYLSKVLFHYNHGKKIRSYFPTSSYDEVGTIWTAEYVG